MFFQLYSKAFSFRCFVCIGTLSCDLWILYDFVCSSRIFGFCTVSCVLLGSLDFVHVGFSSRICGFCAFLYMCSSEINGNCAFYMFFWNRCSLYGFVCSSVIFGFCAFLCVLLQSFDFVRLYVFFWDLWIFQ